MSAAADHIALADKIRRLRGFAEWSSDGLWTPTRHLVFLADRIQRRIELARAGDKKNILIIQAPPRHGKSELTSKRLPAWFLSRWPREQVILASYGHDFARVWGRRVRDVIESKAKILGIKISSAQSSASDWELETGGGMATTGIGGPLTGRGAKLLIVDDPIKNAEEAESPAIRESHWDWWQTTASTRIEPGGCAIVMMTRWNRDDLIGRIQANQPDQCEVISLPAISGEVDALGRAPGEPLWPERWPLHALRVKELSMARSWWAAMYQQDPIASGETEFLSKWFTDAWFEQWPLNMIVKTMVLDPSKGKNDKTADYQAVVKLGIDSSDTLYVQADMKRRPIGQMIADTVDIYRDWQPHAFGLECNSWQDLLAPDFAEEFKRQGVLAPEVWQINNTVNKQVRIRRLAGYLANGRMRFKKDCPGTKILVDQLIDFPAGTHDDGPDALEMAIRLAEQLCNGT